MAETILVGVAWPFPNGSLHLGQIAGAYLPADIFARYHRMAGNRVLMVSGSDQHGTPITVRAEQEGNTPQEVVDYFHAEYLDCWEQLGISFDLYTSRPAPRTTSRRRRTSFTKLLRAGRHLPRHDGADLLRAGEPLPPDRYVEGTCPHCGYDGARGDQCDNCGRILDPST